MHRLQKELHEIMKEPPLNVNVGPKSETDLYKWMGTVIGPEDSDYSGGLFALEITFPEDYPFTPPKLTFRTQIFHPNVSAGGEICPKALWGEWRPGIQISQALQSLVQLLREPKTENPLNEVAAAMLQETPKQFSQTAALWTKNHAHSSNHYQ
eukprot:TRINITY_DN3298_c0_g1_i1.p1 TRINITY_DN3298_c0_g1~~TRINITY_DN3298_c0_g1_i1.p1  ORF type:complete len:153 (-),score=32.82 TRINITY_DN3298_c0_g1_i1:17-475(-)